MSNEQSANRDGVARLRGYLFTLQPGRIDDAAMLEEMLATCWGEFDGGSEAGMSADKLDRMEDVVWEPPRLSFRIERHGGLKLGSTRAELQKWTVNVDHGTANHVATRHRQIHPMQRPLDVKAMADEAVELIVGGREDDRLQWLSRHRVQVRIGKILPEGSAVAETLSGRRKRFATRLSERLQAAGWRKVLGTGPHTYERQT